MSKGRGKPFYDGGKARRDQEERISRRELREAQRGGVEDVTALPDEQQESEGSDPNYYGWVTTDQQKWYVIDTNMIISCVDILYDPDDDRWQQPLNFRPSLENAHLIIPLTVFDELNSIKDRHTVNCAIARRALRRLKRLFPNSERSMDEIMHLSKPISTGWKQQTISILPLHRDFTKSLPWIPDKNDFDGWIAVTALAATMIRDKLPVDGKVSPEEILDRSNVRKDVILLTNDNALLSKADLYGVRTKPYSFDEKPPFTGLRELTVPAEMFNQFWSEERLSMRDFARYMPNEPPFIDNEYIAMTPENDEYPRGYFAADVPFANVARYHKDLDNPERSVFCPLSFMKYEGTTPPNVGIATYYDAMNDDSINVIVVTGKAGTGKTYQIVRHAIKAVQEGEYSKAILIVNADTGIGYLPGSQKKKLAPIVAFCKDAIKSYLADTPEFKKKRELLRKFGDTDNIPNEEEESEDFVDRCQSIADDTIEEKSGGRKRRRAGKGKRSRREAKPIPKSYAQLLEEQVDYIYDRFFEAIPYQQAQGRTFEDAIIIVDEAQRIIIDEMETFITRPGKNSLLVVCGDVNQIKYSSPEKRIKNGLIFTRKIYLDWDGCANIHLTESMRFITTEVANRNYEKVIEEIGELQT